MGIKLKDAIFDIFEDKSKIYFYRFIGITDVDEFNDILKTLNDKCIQNESKCIVFDGEISLQGQMELIQYIGNELNTMNTYDIENEDIVIFDEKKINEEFLASLAYTINLADDNNEFLTENIKNNFITKLIVWAYAYARNIKFDDKLNPKCIYYGNIQKHEIYFLILLNKMNFDVLYINPLREKYFEDIDKYEISMISKEMGMCEILDFKTRCKLGNSITNFETATKQIEQTIEKELFVGTGIYKPWQFRGGYTNNIVMDNTIEDIFAYWNEPSKLREGFSVNKNVVSIPTFFYKIDGIYSDKMKYQSLLKCCVECPNTILFNGSSLTSDIDNMEYIYSFLFCQLNDFTFNIEEVKKLPIYKFGEFSIETQNLILNKLNEFILDSEYYVHNLENESILKLLFYILSMDKKIVKLIDNFDFTSYIPKIVIYLDNENIISKDMLMLLGYINNIGIDVIIFNPSGMCRVDNVLQNINTTRLEIIDYEAPYEKIMSLKQSILNKLFKR